MGDNNRVIINSENSILTSIKLFMDNNKSKSIYTDSITLSDDDFPFDYLQRIPQGSGEGNLCVPICIKIVLETMRHRIKGIPNLSINRINKIIETQSDGTPLGYNIEKINNYLKSTRPLCSFYIDWLIPKWDIICNEVNLEDPMKKPVIMSIYQYDTTQQNFFPHAVVLVKADNANVLYYDPIYGDMFEPTSKFYNQWEYTNRFCIRLKILPFAQSIIEEFAIKTGGALDG